MIALHRTPKTEPMPRIGSARHRRHETQQRALRRRRRTRHGVRTRWVRTELEVRVARDEVADEEILETSPGRFGICHRLGRF